MERQIVLTVRMSERDHERLAALAKEKDLKMSQIVRELVRGEHARLEARQAVLKAVGR